MRAQSTMGRFVSIVVAVFVLSQIGIGLASAASPTENAERRARFERKPVKVDLNTAAESDLQELPGIGVMYSKKIIAGRPYTKVQDLTRSGIPQATIAKITPMVTVHAAVASSQVRVTRKVPIPSTTDTTEVTTTKRSSASESVAPTVPPKKGMVWVNTKSNVYHKEGSRWYGTTAHGKWMNEDDAIKAGSRASKE